MRDLGLLGELCFQSWCAQEGLIANGSKIDKTGWDFFVEFPMSKDISPNVLHKSAINCKVQVKATDKQDRKLPITISNLRQMATAQMPAFYIFLEFDGKNDVQRAFVLHVNNEIIYATLERIYEIEQSDKKNNLNKRSMTLKYNESHLLKELNGESLKEYLLGHIGDNYSKYIEEKNKFLEECGFEDGYGLVKFSLKGDEQIEQIIDLGLGLKDEIKVYDLKDFDQRFGVVSNSPNIDIPWATLKIKSLITKKAKMFFKENKLSSDLSFDVNVIIPPFDFNDFRFFSKFRIIGDFFELICEPYIGKSSYKFDLHKLNRTKIKDLKKALKLLTLISQENKKVYSTLVLDHTKPLSCDITTSYVGRDFALLDDLLDKTSKIATEWHIESEIEVSIQDLQLNRIYIQQFYQIFLEGNTKFRVEFEVDDESNLMRESSDSEIVINVNTIYCKLGNHILGAIVTLCGNAEKISDKKYRLDDCNLKIESKFSYSQENPIGFSDINDEINEIVSRYDKDHNVVFDFIN